MLKAFPQEIGNEFVGAHAMIVALLRSALKRLSEAWHTKSVEALLTGTPRSRRLGRTDRAVEREIAELLTIDRIGVFASRYAQFRAGALVSSDEDLARVIDFFLLTEKSRDGYTADADVVGECETEAFLLAAIHFSGLDDRSVVRRIVERRYPLAARGFADLTSGLSSGLAKRPALRSAVQSPFRSE